MLERASSAGWEGFKNLSFSPLAGNLMLESISSERLAGVTLRLFQSPCGEFNVGKLNQGENNYPKYKVSVPLRGI